MTLSDQPPPAKPHAIRARLEKFSTREEFARGYRQYLSAAGILLPTRQVKPVGTRVALRLELAGGEVALRADGMVTEHRVNSRGQTLGMQIRFDRIEPASRAVIQLSLEGPSEPDSASPASSQPRKPGNSTMRPDLDAFAEELDSTFDSIFATGAFSSVEDTDFLAAISRPGAGVHDTADRLSGPRAAADDSSTGGVRDPLAVARRAESRKHEWSNTLSSDFSVAESSEKADDEPVSPQSPIADETALTEDRSDDRAAQLLAAFGIAPTNDEPVASAAAAADEDESPPIGATTENSAAHALGRINFNRLPANEVAPRRTDDSRSGASPGLTEDSAASARPLGSAWLDDAMRATEEPATRTSDVASLQRLISRVTSEHAVVGGGSESTPDYSGSEPDSLDALLGLTDPFAGSGPAPPPKSTELPDRAITGFGAVTSADQLRPIERAASALFPPSTTEQAPLPANSASAESVDTSASQTLPVPTRPGLVARFFAWLRSLFGSAPK